MNLSVSNMRPIYWPELQENAQDIKIKCHLGFAFDLLVVILKRDGQRDWEGQIGPVRIGAEYVFTLPPGFTRDDTQIGLFGFQHGNPPQRILKFEACLSQVREIHLG